ncbi:hypothetical protein [Ravibacter arvi]|uniref:hypothetical protein n=1 Tax=Ravibacter arvi TaxID=2051041 RepID=UPI0031EC3064
MERMASIEWVSKEQPSTGSGAVRMVPAGWRLSSSKAAYRRLPSGWRVSPSNPFNTICRMSDPQPGQKLSVVYLNQSTKRASLEFVAKKASEDFAKASDETTWDESALHSR